MLVFSRFMIATALAGAASFSASATLSPAIATHHFGLTGYFDSANQVTTGVGTESYNGPQPAVVAVSQIDPGGSYILSTVAAQGSMNGLPAAEMPYLSFESTFIFEIMVESSLPVVADVPVLVHWSGSASSSRFHAFANAWSSLLIDSSTFVKYDGWEHNGLDISTVSVSWNNAVNFIVPAAKVGVPIPIELRTYAFAGPANYSGHMDATAIAEITGFRVRLANAVPGVGLEVSPGVVFAAAVPEPSNWALLLTGFSLMGLTMRLRQRAITA